MKDFLSRYDDGSLRFQNVRFRDGAADTTPFGVFSRSNGDFRRLQFSFSDRNIYVHPAIDRAAGDIICPFDSQVEWDDSAGNYGTMLSLFPVGADFIIRIAHIERLSFAVRKALLEESILEAGTHIGKTGQAGVGTGPHSHTECVSVGATSEICDHILDAKGHKNTNDLADIEATLPDNERAELRAYCYPRNLILFNRARCVRNDGYLIGAGRVTYYSTRALFGM